MSQKPVSPMSSPVSLSRTPSITAQEGDRRGVTDSGKDAFDMTAVNFEVPEMNGPHGPVSVPSISDKPKPTIIDFGDSDMELQVNDTIFRTHKYFLNNFTRLKEMIKWMERCHPLVTAPRIAVYRDENGANDFENMFKVLYASLITGPFEFDAFVLTSALRIATAYDHPSLRAFSVSRIQALTLPAIDRIKIALEFDMTEWKESAYKELCTREAAITTEEAGVLGIVGMERIAKEREEEIKKKWKAIGVQEQQETEKKKREEGLFMGGAEPPKPVSSPLGARRVR